MFLGIIAGMVLAAAEPAADAAVKPTPVGQHTVLPYHFDGALGKTVKDHSTSGMDRRLCQAAYREWRKSKLLSVYFSAINFTGFQIPPA